MERLAGRRVEPGFGDTSRGVRPSVAIDREHPLSPTGFRHDLAVAREDFLSPCHTAKT